MTTLTKKIIRKILREEITKKMESGDWDSRLQELTNELDMVAPGGHEPQKSIISKGLEIKDKNGNLFTVLKEPQGDIVWLQDPEGRVLKLNVARLKAFKVD